MRERDAIGVVALSKSAGTLPNHVTVKCPRCDQAYDLSYSDDEWHRVQNWLHLAERALREDHRNRHELGTIELVMRASVRGR
jgi:hypothetical protein